MLLSDAALAKIITDYEKKLSLARLDLEKAKRESASEKKTDAAVCDAKLASLTERHAACIRDADRKEKLALEAVEKCSKPVPWYQSPQFNFVMGGLIVGGTCVAVERIR